MLNLISLSLLLVSINCVQQTDLENADFSRIMTQVKSLA